MNDKIERLLEQFIAENPYGDSYELAEFMYKKGLEDATPTYAIREDGKERYDF